MPRTVELTDEQARAYDAGDPVLITPPEPYATVIAVKPCGTVYEVTNARRGRGAHGAPGWSGDFRILRFSTGRIEAGRVPVRGGFFPDNKYTFTVVQ